MKLSLPSLRTGIAVLFTLLATSLGIHGQESQRQPSGKSETVDLTLRPGQKDKPTQVIVTIRVLDIDEISGATQTFSANVGVIAEWKDERLAGGEDKRMVRLDKIWHPMMQITNQQRLVTTFPDVAQVKSDGTVKWVQRYWGKFSNPLNLHDFPLDQHTFVIQFISVMDPENTELVILEDGEHKSGMADKLSLPDWEIKKWGIEVDPVVMIEGARPLPGVRFEFEASRYIGYYLIKVLLPLLMIVMMSWIVFWIHPSEASSQISVSVTSMLTLIAYRFALGTMLPKVSYITRMDGFILFASIMVFVALMEAVTTGRLAKTGKEELALRMDRVCRVSFPCVFIAVCIFAFWG